MDVEGMPLGQISRSGEEGPVSHGLSGCCLAAACRGAFPGRSETSRFHTSCSVQMQVSALPAHPLIRNPAIGPRVCTRADPASHREPLQPREPVCGADTAVCAPGGAGLWQDGAGTPNA